MRQTPMKTAQLILRSTQIPVVDFQISNPGLLSRTMLRQFHALLILTKIPRPSNNLQNAISDPYPQLISASDNLVHC
jgi:hypothetical protein